MKQASNGIDLYYEIHGDAQNERLPWLVFSHSLACSVAMWEPQLQAFAGDYRVLAFDTRGHGASDAPAGPYTLEQLADDLNGLLRAPQYPNRSFCRPLDGRNDRAGFRS